jgi:metal-dependent amidase/aminoacylase/carboxypeptidase family protein
MNMTSTHTTSTAHATQPHRVLDGLEEINGSLEDLYRDIHSHPELSMQEHRTAGKAAEQLEQAGYADPNGPASARASA